MVNLVDEPRARAVTVFTKPKSWSLTLWVALLGAIAGALEAFGDKLPDDANGWVMLAFGLVVAALRVFRTNGPLQGTPGEKAALR